MRASYVPLYKGKGDELDCAKYRGLRLLWERVLLGRLNLLVKVNMQKLGFATGRSTTDAIFILRQLQERYIQKKKRLYHIFVYLE